MAQGEESPPPSTPQSATMKSGRMCLPSVALEIAKVPKRNFFFVSSERKQDPSSFRQLSISSPKTTDAQNSDKNTNF